MAVVLASWNSVPRRKPINPNKPITTRHYICVLLLTTFLYLNGLSGDFVYDDTRAITTNVDLRPHTPWYQLWRNDYWGTSIGSSNSHGSYRPLVVLSFRLNYLLHGPNPVGFHVVNLIVHCVVTYLYMRFLCTVLGGHQRLVMISALLFACHPIHVESVTSIVGRADLGAALFYLLAIMSYVKYTKHDGSGGIAYLYMSLALATMSMMTKEHGITCLAVCAVYHLAVVHQMTPTLSLYTVRNILHNPSLARLRQGLSHLAVTVTFLVVARILLMGGTAPTFVTADNPASTNSSLLVRFFTFLYLPVFNFWLLLYPRWLSFDWSMNAVPLVTTLTDHRNLYSLAFYFTLAFILKTIARFYVEQQSSSSIQEYSQNLLVSSNTKATLFEKQQQQQPERSEQQRGQWAYYATDSTEFKHQSSASSVIMDENNNDNNAPNYNHYNGIGNNNNNTHFDANNNEEGVPNRNSTYSTISNSTKQQTSETTKTTKVNNDHSFNSLLNGPTTSKLTTSPSASLQPKLLGRTDCIALSLALSIIPFLPASNLFFYVGFVVAERILYIPSFGYCLFVALCIESTIKTISAYSNRRRRVRSSINFCLAIVIITFSLRTILRNMDWLTEENLYRSGIEINPAKAYGNLGNILSAQGKIDEAKECYLKALQVRPNMADVHYNLGLLLQEQGHLEEALQSYHNAIRFRPKLAVAHLNLAALLARLGRVEQAKKVYRHCASIDSTGTKDIGLHRNSQISALYNLGRMYASEEQYEQALIILHEAVSRMATNYPAQSLFNTIGEMYVKLNRSKEAEKWFKQSLLLKNDHIPVHLTYAKMLTQLNRTAEAEVLYQKALKLAPNDSTIYHHYGQLMLAKGKLEEAVIFYRKGLDVSSNGNVDLVVSMANTLRELNKNVEAERYYELAVKLRPHDALAYSNLGAIYHLNGKYCQAQQNYLQALKLKPTDVVTRTNLSKLKQLISSGTS